MSGTVKGGKAAAVTNKAKYGADFYKRIGTKGGSVTGGSPKGFAANRERASWAGAIGGRRSRRAKTVDLANEGTRDHPDLIPEEV